MDTRHERTSPLDQVFPTGLRRGKEGGDQRKRERKGARERESTLSLDFLTISPSNPDETRSKVDPHCKSYAWASILWSFDKLREVGFFSYLFYSLAKSHFDG